jgi:hypothetical protein
MFPSIRNLTTALAAAATLATVPAVAQGGPADARWQQAQSRFDRELALYRQEFDRYRSQSGGRYDNGGGYRQAPGRADNRYYDDERDEGDYDPARYYRGGSQYQERALSSEDRVYAGQDGRYYCKRSDGTTGLIVGAAGGGILGNVIDGGRSRTVGTLLGAAIGAVAGRAVQQNQSQVRCR